MPSCKGSQSLGTINVLLDLPGVAEVSAFLSPDHRNIDEKASERFRFGDFFDIFGDRIVISATQPGRPGLSQSEQPMDR